MSSMNHEEARVLLDEVSEIQSTTRAARVVLTPGVMAQ